MQEENSDSYPEIPADPLAMDFNFTSQLNPIYFAPLHQSFLPNERLSESAAPSSKKKRGRPPKVLTDAEKEKAQERKDRKARREQFLATTKSSTASEDTQQMKWVEYPEKTETLLELRLEKFQDVFTSTKTKHDVADAWNELTLEFNVRTGSSASDKCLKNRFTELKKQWHLLSKERTATGNDVDAVEERPPYFDVMNRCFQARIGMSGMSLDDESLCDFNESSHEDEESSTRSLSSTIKKRKTAHYPKNSADESDSGLHALAEAMEKGLTSIAGGSNSLTLKDIQEENKKLVEQIEIGQSKALEIAREHMEQSKTGNDKLASLLELLIKKMP